MSSRQGSRYTDCIPSRGARYPLPTKKGCLGYYTNLASDGEAAVLKI